VQPGRRWWILLGGALLVAWIAVMARAAHEIPRCPEGLVAAGARCCGEGQHAEGNACVGRPTRCGPGLMVREDGCVGKADTVTIEGGESSWRPPDTVLGTQGEHATTGRFAIDRLEVTWVRYEHCVDERACATVAPIAGGDPGQSVHGLTRDEARAFCRWAGGRLPSDAEWLRVAIGPSEKRYPWGDPDALCLRAAYGLVSGPCLEGARGPDTAGARPWGATPTGVLDVAGNVAEWVDDGGAPAGQGVVRGGSFADSDASALRARSRRVVPASARLAWVGFRCAYSVSTPSSSAAP
jgi:formylglycine-generating enzyme